MTLFTVMTWNVENLFRPKATAPQADVQRYTQKLNLLATVITRYAPDVVGLQEVGGDDALLDLQQALAGAYPHRAFSGFADQRGIGTAFLSTQPILLQEDLVTFPVGPALLINDLNGDGDTVPVSRMGRGALRIRVLKDALTVDVMTVHLKSKLLSFRRPGGNTSFAPRDEAERAQVAGIALLRRAAEAVTVRLRINELLASDTTHLLLLGDMNDVPDAQTSLILNGPPGSEIGTRGFDTPDKGDAMRLFNLSLVLPEAQRYTRIYRGRGEMLDQIFASQALLPPNALNKRQLPLVQSHIDFAGALPSVDDDPNNRADVIAPDHAPVTAQFDI
jgi:endonuclease/exonuclease/phosphatase family metal-dependent hydrolase